MTKLAKVVAGKVKYSLFFTQRKCCWCTKMMAKLNPSLSQWTSSSLFLSAKLQPLYPKATFPSILHQCCRTKLWVPVLSCPASPLLSSSDETVMMFTAHFSWMDFRNLPSFFCLCFFFSLSFAVIGGWGECSWSEGWGVGGGWGWGIYMCWTDKISEVQVCVFQQKY